MRLKRYFVTYFQNNTPISKLTSEFRKGTSKSMATENSEKVVTREPSKRERKEVKRLDDDYVPAEKKGFPSGVRKFDIGHPPWPLIN